MEQISFRVSIKKYSLCKSCFKIGGNTRATILAFRQLFRFLKRPKEAFNTKRLTLQEPTQLSFLPSQVKHKYLLCAVRGFLQTL